MFDVTIEGAVARLSLNRPAARNAIPIAEWRTLAGRIAGLEGARVLILRSAAPKSFCAGADLGDLATLAEDPAARAEFRLAMRAGLDALGRLPSIAVVEGGCYGAGVALAMACDMRFATPDASFAITPARLGLSYPQEDVSRLVALVGPGQAARLLLGAQTIDGKEAARIGLVEVLDRNAGWLANGFAEAIAANAPASLAELKRAIRGESGDAGFDAAFAGADFAEGLAAFQARRAPVFR